MAYRDPEKRKEWERRYRKKRPEKSREYSKTYRERHKDKISAAQKEHYSSAARHEYYLKDKASGRHQERSRAWNAKHAGRAAELQRLAYARNPEKHRQYRREWYSRHLDSERLRHRESERKNRLTSNRKKKALEWREANREHIHKMSAARIECCANSYIINIICRDMPGMRGRITKDLVEVYKANLLLKRARGKYGVGCHTKRRGHETAQHE